MAQVNCEMYREQLGDYVDERLAPADRAAMDVHVMSCSACMDLLASYMAIPEVVGRATQVAMPPAVRERLRRRLAAKK